MISTLLHEKMVVTFVVGSLEYTCKVLDKRRLNKQRVEAYQIISTIEKGTTGWSNHPATIMWIGYTTALRYYYNQITLECIKRKIEVTMPLYPFGDETVRYQTVDEFLCNAPMPKECIVFPWWFTWEPLIASHRVSLMRKMPEYYTDELWSQEEYIDISQYVGTGYVWPSKVTVEQLLHFTPAYCASIGKGAPANYRWTREQVIEWMANPNMNPKTGRQLRSKGSSSIYADLVKAKKIYNL